MSRGFLSKGASDPEHEGIRTYINSHLQTHNQNFFSKTSNPLVSTLTSSRNLIDQSIQMKEVSWCTKLPISLCPSPSSVVLTCLWSSLPFSGPHSPSLALTHLLWVRVHPQPSHHVVFLSDDSLHVHLAPYWDSVGAVGELIELLKFLELSCNPFQTGLMTPSSAEVRALFPQG